jgi:septal ring factor EnvC (AmiA/AmiB activator)
MSEEFKPINTQEELNAILKERLARQKESIEKNFADYEQLKKKVGDLESANQKLGQSATESASKLAEYEKQIAEKDLKIKGYEANSVKNRIALEVGLPFEMANRLKGETEEEIRKDAELLFKAIGASKPVAPLANPEVPTDGKNQAYQNMLANLKK